MKSCTENSESTVASSNPQEDICCPKCGEKLSAEVMSKAMDSSRMSFTIAPHPGELLSAKNVGGAIANMDELLAEIGKSMGVHTTVNIESISSENGAIKVNMLLARHEGGLKKRKKKS